MLLHERPDEILSVLMFPDDHISVRCCILIYDGLISRHPGGTSGPAPSLPYVPTCPVLQSQFSHTISPGFPPYPLERMLLLLDRGRKLVPRHHCASGCHALQFGGVAASFVAGDWHPLVQKGSLNVASLLYFHKNIKCPAHLGEPEIS